MQGSKGTCMWAAPFWQKSVPWGPISWQCWSRAFWLARKWSNLDRDKLNTTLSLGKAATGGRDSGCAALSYCPGHPPGKGPGPPLCTQSWAGATVPRQKKLLGPGFGPGWAISSTKYWLAQLAPVTAVALRGTQLKAPGLGWLWL